MSGSEYPPPRTQVKIPNPEWSPEPICSRCHHEPVAIPTQTQILIYSSARDFVQWNSDVQSSACQVHMLDLRAYKCGERKIARAILIGYLGRSFVLSNAKLGEEANRNHCRGESQTHRALLTGSRNPGCWPSAKCS